VEWLLTPILMVGGAYLCFEGAEKLWEAINPHHASEEAPASELGADQEEALVKGAIRTDFILSAEIIVISLGAIAEAAFNVRLGVLLAVSVIMTVGVYGLVAGIVKLDDLGLHLRRQSGALQQRIGAGILRAAPWLMKALSVAGTAAMFLVGGGILVHGVPALHHAVEGIEHAAGPVLGTLGSMLANAGIGVVAGALVLGAVTLFQRVAGRGKPAHP